MSQALRKLTAAISRSQTCVIFINQIREKIGVMFGNPETTPGGRALKFYASVRLDIRRIGAIKEGDEVIGNRTRVKVVKNKVAPPFQEAEFDIIFGQGISGKATSSTLAVGSGPGRKERRLVQLRTESIGQGREKAKTYLKEHPEFAADLDKQLRALQLRGMDDRARSGPGTGV